MTIHKQDNSNTKGVLRCNTLPIRLCKDMGICYIELFTITPLTLIMTVVI